jgi:hypothetical protein
MNVKTGLTYLLIPITLGAGSCSNEKKYDSSKNVRVALPKGGFIDRATHKSSTKIDYLHPRVKGHLEHKMMFSYRFNDGNLDTLIVSDLAARPTARDTFTNKNLLENSEEIQKQLGYLNKLLDNQIIINQAEKNMKKYVDRLVPSEKHRNFLTEEEKLQNAFNAYR